MLSELQKKLNYVNAARENRLNTAYHILQHPENFTELLSICFSPNNQNSHKAAWVLEFIAYEKPDWFAPHLAYILENIPILKKDNAIRPLSKILQILLKIHYQNELTEVYFTPEELQKTIEIHFDWLISNVKVATKAYSIRTLYLLGLEFEWIHPELKEIISKDFGDHSAAYKAVAKEVLKKLK